MSAARSLFCCAVLTASAGAWTTTDTTPPVIVSGPVLFHNPNPSAPLAAVVLMRTSEPTQVTLSFDDGVHSWIEVADPVFATLHRTLALGMRPGRACAIQVTLNDEAGNTSTSPVVLSFDAPDLPEHFPLIDLNVNDQRTLEPGVTLFNVFYGTHGGTTVLGGSFVTMVDDQGEVVWFYETDIQLFDVNRLRNGHLLCLAQGSRLAFEINMLGYTMQTWWASALGSAGAPPGATLVDVDTFHHEFNEMPEGEAADFIAISTELRHLPNYPNDEIDPTHTDPIGNVLGEVVVEFKRDGTIVRKVKMLDVLDPYRVCYGSLASTYDGQYGVATHDWGHANTAFIDPSDNTYIVSLRNQDTVVKLRRDNQQIVWILAPHERWNAPWSNHLLNPVPGPFEWQYHQHAPRINTLGNIVLFDNGVFRATPPTPFPPSSEWYTRAVEFKIDAAAHTVRQVWSMGGAFDPDTPPWYSSLYGETDALPQSGHILVTSGCQADPSVPNQTFSRIEEVTRDRPPVKLFELIVHDHPQSTLPLNYNVYRSQRLASVYPDF